MTLRGLDDFVPASFPLPWNPLWGSGIGDFIEGGFPLPSNPIAPSWRGSLPKAPAITTDQIGTTPNGGMGCGCGGSCGGCGMGAFDLTSLQNLIPGTTFGIANTYLALGAVAAFFLFSGGKGRR